MTLDDISYFARRAREEDQAAKQATCAVARERHEEMEDAYRFRCMLARQLTSPQAALSQSLFDHPNSRRNATAEPSTAVLETSPAIAARPFFRA